MLLCCYSLSGIFCRLQVWLLFHHAVYNNIGAFSPQILAMLCYPYPEIISRVSDAKEMTAERALSSLYSSSY